MLKKFKNVFLVIFVVMFWTLTSKSMASEEFRSNKELCYSLVTYAGNALVYTPIGGATTLLGATVLNILGSDYSLFNSLLEGFKYGAIASFGITSALILGYTFNLGNNEILKIIATGAYDLSIPALVLAVETCK